jgi:hypothetical protein
MSLLSRDEIIGALQKLGVLAQERNLSVELWVIGGAAMSLAFNARESTHDVDALIVSPREVRKVRELAKQVADEMRLEEDWLNDGVKGYFTRLSQGDVVLQSPGIVVKRPSVEQLLAMKLSAWRDDVDIEDARILLQRLSGEKSSIWKSIESFLVRGRELKAQYAFQDLWESTYGDN